MVNVLPPAPCSPVGRRLSRTEVRGVTAMREEVNRFFRVGRGLVSVDDARLPAHWYGGEKGLEVSLALGAFNQLDLDAFVRHLRAIDWPEPQTVQLMVREQEDDRFHLIDLFEPIP